jgi:hypothetical protein
MDTQTRLTASVEQAKDLIGQLEAAIKKATDTGEAAYARIILEQMQFDGPWRLTIGVMPPEE